MAGLDPSALEALLRSGDWSDFTIRCKGTEFKVHKMVMGAGSEFLKALFRSQCKETIENAVDLPEDDPETIGRVIEFLYQGKYSDEEIPSFMRQSEPPTNGAKPKSVREPIAQKHRISTMRNHVLAYQAADKFGIPNLKDTAFGWFRDWYHSFDLESSDLPGLVELVYQVTPPEDLDLRRWVTLRCIGISTTLSTRGKIAEIVRRHEPIAWSLGDTLQWMIEQADWRIHVLNDEHAREIDEINEEHSRQLIAAEKSH